MWARPLPALVVLLSSLFLAAPARGEARAPPDLPFPFLLLPGAPGASELSLSQVTSPDWARYSAPWPALLGVGVGAGATAVWASHVPLVPPVRIRTTAQGVALAAVTGMSALGVLISSALPAPARPLRDVRALLMVGPGGVGLTVAVPF